MFKKIFIMTVFFVFSMDPALALDAQKTKFISQSITIKQLIDERFPSTIPHATAVDTAKKLSDIYFSLEKLLKNPVDTVTLSIDNEPLNYNERLKYDLISYFSQKLLEIYDDSPNSFERQEIRDILYYVYDDYDLFDTPLYTFSSFICGENILKGKIYFSVESGTLLEVIDGNCGTHPSHGTMFSNNNGKTFNFVDIPGHDILIVDEIGVDTVVFDSYSGDRGMHPQIVGRSIVNLASDNSFEFQKEVVIPFSQFSNLINK